MPIVPGPSQIGMDVPGASVSGSGADPIGEALTKTGAAIAQSSMTILEQLRRAEAQEESQSMRLQDRLESEKFQAHLLRSSEDGFLYNEDGSPVLNKQTRGQKTVTEAYQEWANQRYETNQKRSTSGLAQDLYRTEQANFFTDQTSRIQADEFNLRASAIQRRQAEDFQATADSLVSIPTLGNQPLLMRLYGATDEGAERILSQVGRMDEKGSFSGAYSPVKGRELIHANNARQTEAAYEGALNTVLENVMKKGDPQARMKMIAEWRASLRGEDNLSRYRKTQGLPIAADMLDANKKAEIDARFIHMEKLAKEHDRSDFNTRLQNRIARAEQGFADPQATAYLEKQMNEMVGKEEASEFERSVFYGRLAAANQIGIMAKDRALLWSPASTMRARAKAAGDAAFKEAQRKMGPAGAGGDAGGQVQQATIGQMSAWVENEIAERDRDPMAYFTGSKGPRKLGELFRQLDFSNPDTLGKKAGTVQAYIKEAQVAHQHAYPNGEKPFLLLPEGSAQSLARKLQDPNFDATRAALAIRGMRQAFGAQYPSLMASLITPKGGSLPAPWENVGNDPTLEGTLAQVQAVRSNINIGEQLKGARVTEKDIWDVIGKDSELENWAAARANMSPNQEHRIQQVNDMKGAISVATAEKIIQRPGLSARDAFEEAKRELLTRHETPSQATPSLGFWSSGATSHNSYPKNMGKYFVNAPQVDHINNWIARESMSEKRFSAMKLVDPQEEADKLRGIKVPADVAKTRYEDYVKQVRTSGVWVVDRADGNGWMALKWKGRGGGALMPVQRVNAKGKVEDVRVSIDEIMTWRAQARVPGLPAIDRNSVPAEYRGYLPGGQAEKPGDRTSGF